MRSILSLAIILSFIICTASLWPSQAAETDTDELTDDQALARIFAEADAYSKNYYDRVAQKYGATAASYMVKIKRHDIYAAFIEMLQDPALKKIAREEWVHREAEAMIGTGRKFVSSVERARRLRVEKKQRRERIIQEKEKEVGVELEDIQ